MSKFTIPEILRIKNIYLARTRRCMINKYADWNFNVLCYCMKGNCLCYWTFGKLSSKYSSTCLIIAKFSVFSHLYKTPIPTVLIPVRLCTCPLFDVYHIFLELISFVHKLLSFCNLKPRNCTGRTFSISSFHYLQVWCWLYHGIQGNLKLSFHECSSMFVSCYIYPVFFMFLIDIIWIRTIDFGTPIWIRTNICWYSSTLIRFFISCGAWVSTYPV